MDVSAKGCAVIENRQNQPPSRGWKSTVEPARAPREAFILPRHDMSRLHLNAGGCFKVRTTDFHPWLSGSYLASTTQIRAMSSLKML